jgi:hypothetical protein
MMPQEPARGILKQEEWGLSKIYRVQCDCGDDDCSHVVDIEVDSYSVSVSIHTNVHTKWWEKSRWKQIWQILTKGNAEHQSTIIMKPQTAANYAGILLKSLDDVKELKEKEHE